MGVKRPHAFEGRNDDAHTSTKSIHPRFTKRTHLNASKPNSTSSSAAAINPIKAKIRDVTRLLKRSDNLPAGVRTEKERALAGYEQDLQQAQAEKRKQQMISKYHMVRFFGQWLDHEMLQTMLTLLGVCILIYHYYRTSKSYAAP